MNDINAFIDALIALEKTIAITNPVSDQVKAAYWGAPARGVPDLPCCVNAWTEPERQLGFGSLTVERPRVQVQMLVADAMTEDERSARIATSFWFAAKTTFDASRDISATAGITVLVGADPTVPVLLQHGGKAYIGFNAFLDLEEVSS